MTGRRLLNRVGLWFAILMIVTALVVLGSIVVSRRAPVRRVIKPA